MRQQQTRWTALIFVAVAAVWAALGWIVTPPLYGVALVFLGVALVLWQQARSQPPGE